MERILKFLKIGSDVLTPQVLVSHSALTDNVSRMCSVADAAGCSLRPHIKTHKTIEIAEKVFETPPIQNSEPKITCSKVSEALCYASEFRDILVAHPLVDPRKVRDLLFGMTHVEDPDFMSSGIPLCGSDDIQEILLEQETQMNLKERKIGILCDGEYGLSVLRDTVEESVAELSLASSGVPLVSIHVKIDVGFHRCGIDMTDEGWDVGRDLFMGIMESICEAEESMGGSVRFGGILTHAGQVYGANSHAEVESVVYQELEIMARVKDLILRDFDRREFEVSVGSTPTCWMTKELLDAGKYPAGIVTEFRPGNFVFNDLTQMRLGANEAFLSQFVLAQIVSENSRYYIVDCGSKVLSNDLGAGGNAEGKHGMIAGREDLFLQKLSEEHGWVRKAGTSDLAVGDTVLVIPNHACPVANLADTLLCVHDEDDYRTEQWEVVGRGKVR